MADREITRTEAIVLRSLNYGETSQIVTLFTRKKGKLGVMAKGARRTKSSFGSTLQPMAYTQVVFYYKSTRTLQILSESSHVDAFHGLRRDLETLTVGFRVVELIDALLEAEDPQPPVFSLAVQVLRRLDETERRAGNLWPYAQLRLAQRLGIAPSIERARVEAVDEEGILCRTDGGVYPANADPPAPRRASRSALRAYAVFAKADLDTVMRMKLDPAVRAEVEDLVRDFLRYHVQEAYPDRSEAVIAQLRRSRGSSQQIAPS